MTNLNTTETKKEEFTYQDWLDGFTQKIEEIPYITAWTGHTVKIVNQQSKKIDFAGHWDMSNEEDVKSLGNFLVDRFGRNGDTAYTTHRFDSVDGWVVSPNDKHPLRLGKVAMFGRYNPNETIKTFKTWSENPTAHRMLYRVARNVEGRGFDGEAILVYFPEYNTIRRLGYWEYKLYWLTKYIPYKIKNEYGWKSWHEIKKGLSK